MTDATVTILGTSSDTTDNITTSEYILTTNTPLWGSWDGYTRHISSGWSGKKDNKQKENQKMRKLYGVTVVEIKTDEILIDKKVPAKTEIEAVLKASGGKAIDTKKVDVVVRDLGALSDEPEIVRIEKE